MAFSGSTVLWILPPQNCRRARALCTNTKWSRRARQAGRLSDNLSCLNRPRKQKCDPQCRGSSRYQNVFHARSRRLSACSVSVTGVNIGTAGREKSVLSAESLKTCLLVAIAGAGFPQAVLTTPRQIVRCSPQRPRKAMAGFTRRVEPDVFRRFCIP